MAPARGAANIADRLFGWHPDGLVGDFWLIFTFLGVTMNQKSSVTQFASLVSQVPTGGNSLADLRHKALRVRPYGYCPAAQAGWLMRLDWKVQLLAPLAAHAQLHCASLAA